MILGSKKNIVVGIVGVFLLFLVLGGFWAFYLRHTAFYVSLFSSEAANPGRENPIITVDLKGNGSDSPAPVGCGSSVRLSWTSSINPAGTPYKCTASGGSWSGLKNASGNENVGPVNGPVTYTLTCQPTLSGASNLDSVTVTCTAPTQTPVEDPAQSPAPGASTAPPKAGATADPIVTCPLTTKKDGKIFNFPNPYNNYILANKTSAIATKGPYNFSLAAGTYKVTLVAYDDHSRSGGQGQTKEKYYVILKDAAKGKVAQSGATADIPESQDYAKTVVNQSLSLASGTKTITAFHAAYKDGGPQSVTPVCAGFLFWYDARWSS